MTIEESAAVHAVLEDELFGLDVSAGKSVRYHAYRRAFWKSFARLAQFLTAFTGTSTFIALTAGKPELAGDFGLTVAVVSSLDLVFNFHRRSDEHDKLYRRWHVLLSQIAAANGKADPELLSRLRVKRLSIERDEPSVIDLLERRCEAEERLSRGISISDEPSLQLAGYKVLISQWAFLPSSRSLRLPGDGQGDGSRKVS